jgi:hypothetical protein
MSRTFQLGGADEGIISLCKRYRPFLYSLLGVLAVVVAIEFISLGLSGHWFAENENRAILYVAIKCL